MKAIVLAGGQGSRLYPMTKIVSKQLQPIFDKPMIYYPLSTIMLLGVRDICLISTPRDIGRFEELLGDGRRWGIDITYQVQEKPEGIAQAFLVAEEFIDGDPCGLILGDNLFYGPTKYFREPLEGFGRGSGAVIYGYGVEHPEAYGVVNFDKEGNPVAIEEKPEVPKSNIAVPGLYFYDEHVVEYARELEPSARGELEITDLNRRYLREGKLEVGLLGRGVAWLDTGTPTNLLAAGNFIQILEKRQGLKIGCLEEVALRMNTIDTDDFDALVEEIPQGEYRSYLEKIRTEF